MKKSYLRAFIAIMAIVLITAGTLLAYNILSTVRDQREQREQEAQEMRMMLGLSWNLDLGVRNDRGIIFSAWDFYHRNIDTPEMQQIRHVLFVYEEEDAQQYADDPTILVAWPTRYTELGIETLNNLIPTAYELGKITGPLRLVSMDDLFEDPEFVYEMIGITIFRSLHGTWRSFKQSVDDGNGD